MIGGSNEADTSSGPRQPGSSLVIDRPIAAVEVGVGEGMLEPERAYRLPILLLLTCACLCWSACTRTNTPPPSGPNILIVLIDTLRYDAIGADGGPQGYSPTFDSLAAEGLLFTEMRSQSPWTRPSVGTLLTSRYPSELGIDHGGHHGVMQALPSTVDYLPELLRNQGYSVAALFSNPHLKVWTRFDRGFELYEYVDHRLEGEFRARTESVLDSLARGDRPFFFYVHTMEPHLPYRAHPELNPPAPRASGVYRPPRIDRKLLTSIDLPPDLRKHIRDLYHEEVLAADRWAGELLERLRRAGAAENTIVLMTSDHGEEHWEHGSAEHGHTLYEELLRVPAVLSAPGELREYLGTGAITRPARILDLAPTLLDLAGLPRLPGARGTSLLGAPVGGGRADEPWLAEATLYGDQLRAVRAGDWKLIRNLATDDEELYELVRDPGERNDLLAAGVRPPEYARVAFALDSLSGTCEPPEEEATRISVDSVTRGQLESLGYLGD
ncbi:MAG: hypothetical protein CME06_00765 [Gemmatimonadetes bacterium]|nr:hypothetical protein [Gemmatimonadota bacterium]